MRGVVEEVGEGVTDIKVGDTAIVSWIAMCGECKYCAMGRPALCDVGASATITLPDGTTPTAVTFGKGWIAVVTDDNRILILDAESSALRQTIMIE